MHYLTDLVNNMNRKQFLSVIIIAKNEGIRIGACLEHVAWADEIIVIDNGSVDHTASIARRNKATVIQEQTQNFAKLRNAGARYAHGDWLLFVDADETVTPPLHQEIIKVIHDPKAVSAYVIPRHNIYLGHSWPYQDGMVRLIRKESFVTWEGVLHEHAIVRGNVGSLNNVFIHNTHRSLTEMVAKTNEWSDYEAKLRLVAKHPAISWWRILRVMGTAFIESFFRQGGWRVGTIGWIESIFQSFSIFITYTKLWEMQNKKI
jgi:glycosyltransferase involved in cell wall biosynthesis